MNNQRTKITAPVLCLGVALCCGLLRGEEPRKPEAKPAELKLGLNVGETVPISSMHVLFGDRFDSNTCLAGKNRGRNAVSIYVTSIEEPRLGDLVKKVEQLIGTDENLAAYVLITKGKSEDDGAMRQAHSLAKDFGLKRTEIAISNGGRLDVNKTAAVTVVYSEKRRVAIHLEFEAGKLDAAAIASVTEALAKAIKPE